MRLSGFARLLAFLLALLVTPIGVADAQQDKVAKKLRELMTDTFTAQGKNYFAARKKAEIWLRYARKKRGATHQDTTMAMQTLASMYSLTGSQGKAEALYRELLQIAERVHGPESQRTAQAIDQLASSYWAQQRLDEAEGLYARSIKIYKKVWGADSDMYAGMLSLHAAFAQSRYMFGAAEQIYFEQQRIYKKNGNKGGQLNSVQLSLGMLYGRQGDIKKAKAAFDRVIRGYEKTHGRDDTTVLPSMLQSIAGMYAMWGKPAWSKTLYERAEKAYRRRVRDLRADPKTHPATLTGAQHMLAMVLQKTGKLEEAAQMFENILAANEKQYGKGSFQASGALYPLAEIYKQKGDFKKARRILKTWAKSYQKTFGGFTATTPLIMLADLERTQGNFKEAKRLATKVMKAAAKNYGKSHPMTQRYAETIALNELALGNAKKALSLLEKSYAVEKKAIALVMASGTESDNRTYLTERRHQMHMAVSLHAQYLKNNKRALKLGLDTVLVHKGRLLDASAASVASLRQRLSKQDRELLDKLAAARGELANLVIAGPKATDGDEEKYAKEITRLERLVRKLEGKVRSRSAVFRAREQPIEIKKIQKAIPSKASLVEIVTYRRVDPKAKLMVPQSSDRYGAYVLTRKGAPAFVDLGPTKRIDDAVGKLRHELSSASGSNYERYGKLVYNLVYAKIEPLLGKRKFVLMAPDGALNLVPFAALVDPRGKFLVERFSFSYLTSGRDLLRLGVKISSKGGPVIFADPSFDESGNTKKGKSRGLTSRALRKIKWTKLPGTAVEAEAIVKLISDAKLWSGEKATEAKLKTVSAPRILHLATHGFFLPGTVEELPQEPADNSMPVTTAQFKVPAVGSGQDNPLLRSGLALAGANKLASGTEDGVLTALEASNLDLWGTKLVVLSACETGVGKVSQGEGVYGLRRALVMAGAESMLMSLWQVDDAATKDLMIGYYKRLGRGKGRADALRLIQLSMLRSEKHSHPFYWASFIPSGAWTPMK